MGGLCIVCNTNHRDVQDHPFTKSRLKATELEYLKWFYREADFGPADEDVRDIMNESFVRATGKELPDGYKREE